jgi:hypothetical protein
LTQQKPATRKPESLRFNATSNAIPIEQVILDAVAQAEAEEGEQMAAFLQAGNKKVNAKSVAVHAVADLRGHADHQKERPALTLSGLIPNSEVSRRWIAPRRHRKRRVYRMLARQSSWATRFRNVLE